MTEAQDFFQLLAGLLLEPRTAVLLALLATAAVIDWKTMRIPNWLTAAGAAAGLAVSLLTAPHWGSALMVSLGGLSVGLCVLLPLWFIRVLGAGDVKLMAAAGTFLGPLPTLHAFAYVAMAGGVMALVVAASRGSLGRLLQNVYFLVAVLRTPGGTSIGQPLAPQSSMSVGKLPYGVCIAAGTAGYLVARQFGLA